MRIDVPGSKSMTQRALVIGALSANPRPVRNALMCDDSERLTALLRGLGAGVQWSGRDVAVSPAPLRAEGQRFDCGNAGTTARFGAALSLATDGPFLIDGDARMRERPIAPLGNALRLVGVRVEAEHRNGHLPMWFERQDVAEARATVSLEGSQSSQFTSALMLVGPALAKGLKIELRGEVVSAGYIDMTARMMSEAGARVTIDGRAISVEPGGYPQDRALEIEPDWSSASFALAASFITGIDITIEGMRDEHQSVQGDSIFPRYLERLQSANDQTFDLNNTPDLIPPLAVSALFAAGRTTITGVKHARLKESDRISSLATELKKLGADVEERPDGLVVQPLGGAIVSPTTLTTHADHRLAMAFGVISLRLPQVAIDDPACVSKSWPRFWDELDKIRAAQER